MLAQAVTSSLILAIVETNMELPKADEIKKQLNDKKLKEVIKRLRHDKQIATDVHEMVEASSTLRRNATSIARQMPLETVVTAGSLNQKMKQQQRYNTARELYKQRLAADKDEILCVMVPQKGSASSFLTHRITEKVMEEDKWTFELVNLGGETLVAMSNSMITSGVNRTASRIIGKDACGPIIFISIDEDDEPIDIEVSHFKSLLS